MSDELARQTALDVSKSFIVQAPAGSGKTELLTRRFLKLLAVVNSPEEIVALTFTRKAAGEMRFRIINALLKAREAIDTNLLEQDVTLKLALDVLRQDKKCNWDLLLNPNRLNITTIDALCTKIVQKMPLLSRTATTNICDDPKKYYEQAVFELFKLINHNNIADTDQGQIGIYQQWTEKFKLLFAHFGASYSKLQGFLISMLYKRDQWLPYLIQVKSNEDYHDRIKECFEQLTADVTANIDQSLSLAIKCKLNDLLAYARNNLLKYNNSEDLNSTQAILVNYQESSLVYWQAVAVLLFTQDDKLSFRKTIDKRLGFPAKTEGKNQQEKELYINSKAGLLSLIDELNNDNLILLESFALLKKLPLAFYDNWEILDILANVLVLLEAELRLIFKQNNTIDFQGVTQGALYALEAAESLNEQNVEFTTSTHNFDISLWLDYKISHLLVDEFQDTSYTQFRLISNLIAGWEPFDARTIFLVGDPMQSIYRFRQADVSLFLRVRQNGINNLPIEFLRLTKNFRSEQQVVDWLNSKFEDVFPKKANNLFGAIEYSRAEATKPEGANNQPKLFLFNNLNHENIHIVDSIKAIIKSNNNDKPISIAVLIRNRTRIVDLILLLKQNNININAVEIELLANRMVIQDLLSLTKAVLDLSDRVSWYSILRAPWCGLTLNELYLLNFGNEDKTIYEIISDDSLAALFSTEMQAKLANIKFVLEHLFKNLLKINLYKLIEQAWYALGGAIIYSAPEDLSDAKQFFNLLFSLEESFCIDVDVLVETVSTLYSAGTNQSAVDQKYTVDIMTIHKAKGLQFDYVILPYFDQSAKVNEHQMLAWQQYHTQNYSGIMLAPYYLEDDEQQQFYKALRYIEQQKESYELSRLLYVAVTRAIKKIIITASLDNIDNTADGIDQIKVAYNSLLAKIINVLDPEEIIVSDQTTRTMASHGSSQHIIRYLDYNKFKVSECINNKAILFESLRFNTRDIFKLDSENNNPSEYIISDDWMRIVGIFIHKILYNIAVKNINIEVLLDDRMSLLESWRNSLLSAGIGFNNINKALAVVQTAVDSIINSKVSRWILADYQISYAEKEFFYIYQAEIKKSVIDRLFIDKDKIWIIDYKLGDDELTSEQNYEKQLRHYSFLVKMHFAQLIKEKKYSVNTAIYYPLTDKFLNFSESLIQA